MSWILSHADWRGAAATAQPEDDTAGGRRGAPDEAESWDFRQIDRQGTDASDKQAPDRQESWDFRQIERQGTDASENRAPERQESWDFRQIDRHGTDAPEKQEPDRKESWDFRQIEREPTQNTKQGQKWEEIRNRARQEENRSTEDRADIGEKFAALRTGEGSTAAAVGNGDYKLSEMRNGRVERWRPSRRTEDSTESVSISYSCCLLVWSTYANCEFLFLVRRKTIQQLREAVINGRQPLKPVHVEYDLLQ